MLIALIRAATVSELMSLATSARIRFANKASAFENHPFGWDRP
jgi:hypothetical protein